MADEDEEERGTRLPAELRALGRAMPLPDVDGETMAERVLAGLLADAVPAPAPLGRAARLRRWLRGRWRAVTAALSGLLVILVLTPPVRAAVTDWFDFGGIAVRYDPAASPPAHAPVPGCGDPVSLAEASHRAGFAPRVPAGIAAPVAVSVAKTAGGGPVVSLCWRERGRTVRLDEFAASLDIAFTKQVRLMPQWLNLENGATGMWFAEPHLLRFRLIGGDSGTWTESARTAGPTLLWEGGPAGPAHGDGVRLTLRLEGVASLERARAVAESLD